MKKNAIALIAGALGMLGVATTSYAAPDAATPKKWEITLVGSGSSDTDFDSTGLAANGQVGYYFTDQWQLNLRQGFGFTDSDGGGSDFNASTAIGGDFHFDFGQDQRVVPFVGADIGYLYGDGVSDTFFAGLEGGLKWYVNDTTFIFGQASYEWLFDNGNDIDDQFDDGRWVYSLGIGFRF